MFVLKLQSKDMKDFYNFQIFDKNILKVFKENKKPATDANLLRASNV